MNSPPFVLHERVRWGDVDLAGIMRWDAYNRLFEMGEAELFREIGHPLQTLYADIWLPRKVAHAEYVTPALLDDLLRIEVCFSNIGRTSVTVQYEVRSNDRAAVHVRAHQVLVCVGRTDFVKRELPAELRTAMQQFLLAPAAARGSAS